MTDHCLDIYGPGEQRELKLEKCHYGQGAQYFRYDLNTKQIFHSSLYMNRCVEIDTGTYRVFETACNSTKNTQKFEWGFVNETNVRNWLTYGSKIVDEKEIQDLEKFI